MSTDREAPIECNCCCGCKKAFTPEELSFYARLPTDLTTALCHDCQDKYEREVEGRGAETS